ncbi:ATP-binding protein [Tepidamorphus sp. 3E244]|uniref:ATP-binding protein n=1 Tax=Tepidamorphus sp. 3E244 TaxID=3385498 RepID=UPI0038FC932D
MKRTYSHRLEMCPACRLKPDGTILHANPAFEEICGVVDAFGEVNVLDLVIESQRPALSEAIAATAAQMEPRHIETELAGDERTDPRQVVWTLTGIGDEVIVTGRDLSEVYAYEHALERLISLKHDTTISLDQSIPRILEIAHRFLGMRFGLVNKLLGNQIEVTHLADPERGLYEGMRLPLEQTFCSYIIACDRLVAIRDTEKQRPNGFPEHPFNSRIRSLLGVPIYVSGRLYGALLFGDDKPRETNFTNDQRNLLSLTAEWLSHELAARERTQAAEASEKRYRNLYRRTPVMMHSVNWNGRLVEVSDTWIDKLGYTRDEVIGREPLEFMTDDSALKAMAKRVSGSASNMRDWHEEYRFRRKDGSIMEVELSSIGDWAEAAALPPMQHQRNGRFNDAPTVFAQETSLCVLVDVTERNSAQRNNIAANAELRRANEDLRRFNLIASHDLQEPLRKIRTFASILSREAPQNMSLDGAYAMGAIVRSSKRLSTLITDLLEYARADQASPLDDEIDLHAVAQSIARVVCAEHAVERAAFRIRALPQVRGSRVQVERLLTNLFANAIKYRDARRKLVVEVFAQSDAEQVRMIVRDNGIGVPAAHRERVFQPFQRLHSKGPVPGSGMGLAICRNIATHHGWALSTEDAPDIGTDFTLAIPRSNVIERPKSPAEPGEQDRAA